MPTFAAVIHKTANNPVNPIEIDGFLRLKCGLYIN